MTLVATLDDHEKAIRGGKRFLTSESSDYGDFSVHSTHSIRSTASSRGSDLSLSDKKLRQFKHSTKRIQVGVAQLPAKKDQDRFAVDLTDDPDIPHYFAVFDGHGTSSLAADVSTDRLLSEIIAADKLLNNEEQMKIGPSVPCDEAICAGFQAVDQAVLSQADMHPRTGTCVVALMVGIDGRMDEEALNDENDAVVKCAWVGDSRCVMIDDFTGEVKSLSKDHRVDDNEKEMARILEANHDPRPGLLESPGWQSELSSCAKHGIRPRAGSFIARRVISGADAGPRCVFAHTGGVSLQISRSIGDYFGARSVISTPEITTIRARSNQSARFILASDGLWDVFTSTDAAKAIENILDPKKAASKLVQVARTKRLYSGRTQDDITVVVVDVNRDPVVKSSRKFGRRASGKCTIM